MKPVALHAHNPGPMTGSGNWTWLIPGRLPTLIDAGIGEPEHLDDIERALEGAGLAQVIVTHAHTDHAAGVTAIAERMPSVRFLKIPWPDRDARWDVPWSSIHDGDVVEAGDTSVVVVHTPGHAPDHACLWEAASRSLFGGDLVIGSSTVWIPSALGGDLIAYIRSLERVMALNPSQIFPAHGPVITNPGVLLRGYLAHRQQRELQVIDALRLGDTTPAAIVARVYPEIDKRFLTHAVETVLAHLVKLEHDGVAGRRGDAWHIIEP